MVARPKTEGTEQPRWRDVPRAFAEVALFVFWTSWPRWGRGLFVAVMWMFLHLAIAEWGYLQPLEAAEAAARSGSAEPYQNLRWAKVIGYEESWVIARPWIIGSAICGIVVVAIFVFPALPGRLVRSAGRGYRASQRWIVSNWRDE